MLCARPRGTAYDVAPHHAAPPLTHNHHRRAGCTCLPLCVCLPAHSLHPTDLLLLINYVHANSERFQTETSNFTHTCLPMANDRSWHHVYIYFMMEGVALIWVSHWHPPSPHRHGHHHHHHHRRYSHALLPGGVSEGAVGGVYGWQLHVDITLGCAGWWSVAVPWRVQVTGQVEAFQRLRAAQEAVTARLIETGLMDELRDCVSVRAAPPFLIRSLGMTVRYTSSPA